MTAESILDEVRAFKSRHPAWFEFCQAFSAGLLAWLAVSLLPLQTLETVRRGADDAADRMMRLSSFTTDRLERALEFAIFDIDDVTWHDWGAPLTLPRDKLRDLVVAAVSAKSRAIVLDVDLAFPDADDRQSALADFLARYPADAPPLFLVRSLVEPPPGAAVRPSLRATRYDGAVADAVAKGARITWGTPLFDADADSTIRRWRLIEISCDKGAARPVPSLALAVVMAARRDLPAVGAAKAKPFEVAVAPLVPHDCNAKSMPTGSVTIGGEPLGRPIVLNGPEQSQRVIFRIAWRANEPSLGPRVAGGGQSMHLVEVRSARAVLAADVPTLSRLSNRVVLIGGSFAASGDIHATPIGAMPGVLVLANAMHALAYNGTPRVLSPWQSALITLAILAITSAAIAVFRPSVAAFASAAGVVLIMILSLPIFRSGAVLSLAVPALGAFFHESIGSLVKTAESLREERWRWFLRSHTAAAGKPKVEGPST